MLCEYGSRGGKEYCLCGVHLYRYGVGHGRTGTIVLEIRESRRHVRRVCQSIELVVADIEEGSGSGLVALAPFKSDIKRLAGDCIQGDHVGVKRRVMGNGAACRFTPDDSTVGSTVRSNNYFI